MAEEEPQEGFTVRDRRRFAADAPPPAPAVEAVVESVAEPLAADEISAGEEEGFLDEEAEGLPDVHSMLLVFLGQLRNLAWFRMGLIADPTTNRIERDLKQARVAIDTIEFLAKQLDSVVEPEERLPLKALVSDLQINFVEQSKRGL
jgi:hypothetical protein